MPEMRKHYLKSRAINCGQLSEMIRGIASGYFSWRARALAHAQCGRNALAKLKLDALSIDELNQAVAVCSRIATDAGIFGKLLPRSAK